MDAYLNFTDDLSDDLNLTGFVGVNRRIRNYKRLNAYTLGGLNTPGLYTVNNGADGYEVGDFTSSKSGQLCVGQCQLSDTSASSSWTSRAATTGALPSRGEQQLLLPIGSASYVLSEDLDIDAISFAKVRLGWAQVGNDTDPYRTSTTYG